MKCVERASQLMEISVFTGDSDTSILQKIRKIETKRSVEKILGFLLRRLLRRTYLKISYLALAISTEHANAPP